MHTDRLIIRPWLPRDWAPFAQLNQHPKVARCCPDQQSRDASRPLKRAAGGCGRWS